MVNNFLTKTVNLKKSQLKMYDKEIIMLNKIIKYEIQKENKNNCYINMMFHCADLFFNRTFLV